MAGSRTSPGQGNPARLGRTATIALLLTLASLLSPSLSLSLFSADVVLSQDLRAGLRGRVRDADTDEPVVAATVRVRRPDRDVIAYTDEEGAFRFPGMRPGSIFLEVEHIRFEDAQWTVTLLGGKTKVLDIAIARKAYVMDPLEVEVAAEPARRMRGFNQRRDREKGYFFARSDIEESDPIYPSDLLRSIPGVRLLAEDTGDLRIVMGAGKTACEAAVFWDGSPMQAIRIDDYLPEHIEAIEVYTRFTSTPPPFRSRARRCGSVVVWSRESLEEQP